VSHSYTPNVQHDVENLTRAPRAATPRRPITPAPSMSPRPQRG